MYASPILYFKFFFSRLKSLYLTYHYPGSRIGFAIVSSYMLLLLVQAPSKDHATRAKRLVHMWRQVLRRQSDVMNLTLVRLDGVHWTGLCQNYYLPKRVKEALDETMYQ
jgi:hypothetical protein